MALKVWLPLDGDLHNQGCSSLQFSYSGSNISVNSSGKIGQCYKRTAAAADAIISNSTINLGTNQSMFCWIKMDSFQSSSLLTGILGQHRYSTNTGMGITLRYASASTGYASINTGTGSARTYNTYYGSTLLNAGTWYHIGYTYDGSNIRIYVNGNLDKTQAFTGMSCPADYIQIGNWSFGGSSGTNITNYSAPGCINDVRIYDHCLSPAEVYEIAQGLVLHYKLDSIEIKNGTNLVTGITTGGQTTLLTDGRLGVQTSGQNADTYFKLNLSENIVKDTTYFLSCDASGIPEGQYWYFPLGSQSNTALSFKIYNGHNEMIFTANNITWTQYGDLKLMLDDIRAFYGPTQFYNFQLIKLSASNTQLEIKDSSGYSHHAVLTDGAQATNTSRYTSSLALTAATKAIGNPIFEAGVFIPEYTWAGWIKRNYTTAAAKQIHANMATILLYTDFTPYIGWTSGKINGSTTGNGAAGGSAATILDEWVHMAITYKSGIGKFYINGELIKTWDYTSQGVYIVTAANNTLGNGFIGNLSDVRIYTTALLDTDIKLLYNLGMKVDNLQNIHEFELKETQDNLFRSELISPAAKANRTVGIGEIMYHNNDYAMNIRPEPFYKNLENDVSGILQGYFEENTSYTFDLWIDVDEVIYQDVNRTGGLRIYYTDGTRDSTFELVGGNQGYQHKRYISPPNKTIDRLEIYYYTNLNVYYRLDSYICKTDTNKIKKNGLLTGANFAQSTKASILKGGAYYATNFIER